MAWLLACAGLGLLLICAVHAAAYARHARVKRRLAATTPFEDDAHAVPTCAEHVRLVGAETVVTLWLLSALPTAGRPRTHPGHEAVLLVAPPALPPSALRRLARAIARPGRVVAIGRVPARSGGRALGRLIDHVARLRGATGGAPVTLILFGGAVRRLDALLERLPAGAVRRALLLGATARVRLPRADLALASIYSLDDAWVSPPDAARHAGADNVALRGWGHLSLLVGEGVHTLVRETLGDGDDASAASRRP